MSAPLAAKLLLFPEQTLHASQTKKTAEAAFDCWSIALPYAGITRIRY
jgi:hypothetical protein